MDDEKLQEKLDEINHDLQYLKAQNRKIINVLTNDESLERSQQYEEIYKMAVKTRRGVTRKQAADILDINHRNVGTHFEKMSNKYDDLVVAEGRGQKPERLVHTKYTIASPDSSGSKSGNVSSAAKSWLGG